MKHIQTDPDPDKLLINTRFKDVLKQNMLSITNNHVRWLQPLLQPRVYIIQIIDIFAAPPPFFSKIIFLPPSTVKISSFPPFLHLLPHIFAFSLIKYKSSYHFPNQPIIHIFVRDMLIVLPCNYPDGLPVSPHFYLKYHKSYFFKISRKWRNLIKISQICLMFDFVRFWIEIYVSLYTNLLGSLFIRHPRQAALEIRSERAMFCFCSQLYHCSAMGQLEWVAGVYIIHFDHPPPPPTAHHFFPWRVGRGGNLWVFNP